MPASSQILPQRHLARQVRQFFVESWCAGMPDVDKAVQEFLTALMSQTGTQREMQTRRDAWMQYQQHHGAWVRGVVQALPQALAAPDTGMRNSMLSGVGLELVSDDVVDNKIIAARMALTVMEQVSAPFDALRMRIYRLEGRELPGSDILRPEAICLVLVEQWVQAALSRDNLQLVIDPLQRALAELAQTLYQRCNDQLEQQGVVAQQMLRVRVQRGSAAPGVSGAAGTPSGAGSLVSQALEQSQGRVAAAGHPYPPSRHGAMGARSGHGHASTGYSRPAGMPLPLGLAPLARARQRAQGVMVQLRRLLAQPEIGYDVNQAAVAPASAALAHALAAHQVHAETYYSAMGSLVPDYSPAAVVQLVGAVRERSVELKKTASTDSEKAIIEVVALMFQSILSEDRIPPAVRVWFARLQVPVLRVALAEPEFFSNLNHPARQLIDRMGSCVLGFDASSIDGSALEAEIRRVVQVIEQYPETGRRVFQLVHDEFEKFLAKFLTQKQSTARVATVAQQVEQKETLAIQYTIELRTMLKDMPVRDEIREFLFKVWAEVLAVSAVRDGAHDAATLALKRAAADLVWAASAKPSRSDRAQVIQSLPDLLQRLRLGLTLMGVTDAVQDAQIKALTDTLAEAFLSKTAAIPHEHIEAMAKRLENLEDFIDDAVMGDFPLDADHIEMMLGIDASAIHVVADNGAPVEDAMVQWAQALQLGMWFTLDHNASSAQVQYAWHSQRKQLHLFAATDGSTYLVQLRRLGAYLQAGLLVAQDEEGLTVRATRDALAKIDANPERLLG